MKSKRLDSPSDFPRVRVPVRGIVLKHLELAPSLNIVLPPGEELMGLAPMGGGVNNIEGGAPVVGFFSVACWTGTHFLGIINK